MSAHFFSSLWIKNVPHHLWYIFESVPNRSKIRVENKLIDWIHEKSYHRFCNSQNCCFSAMNSVTFANGYDYENAMDWIRLNVLAAVAKPARPMGLASPLPLDARNLCKSSMANQDANERIGNEFELVVGCIWCISFRWNVPNMHTLHTHQHYVNSISFCHFRHTKWVMRICKILSDHRSSISIFTESSICRVS